MARLVQLIESQENKGDGKERNPFRQVTRFYQTDGQLVVEIDPYENIPKEKPNAQDS